MKRVAISGATGFIARELIPHLESAGYRLVLFGRNIETLHASFPQADCYSYEHFGAQVRGCDAVIHTAVMNNDAQGSLEDFRAVNVDFSIALATQAQAAGVPLFINLTTLHALGPRFHSAYAQSKYEAEQALNQLSGIAITHLRLPAVYGDSFRGRLAILNALPTVIRKPLFDILASLRPTLHTDRLARKVLLVLTEPSVPQELLLADGQEQNVYYKLLSRAMDLSFVACVLLFLSWVMLISWVVISLSSRGSAIFAQPRVGRDGKAFTCYKFRTMYANVKQAATHEMGQASITPVGKFMRRTKIDELPQIVNIVFNEMSLVGPRPCLVVQHELIDWRRRLGVLSVKPGITGLAQIQGVDMSHPERLARLDAQYIKRRSILLDLKIVLATARGSGATDYTKRQVSPHPAQHRQQS